jgi:hypothetical protein
VFYLHTIDQTNILFKFKIGTWSGDINSRSDSELPPSEALEGLKRQINFHNNFVTYSSYFKPLKIQQSNNCSFERKREVIHRNRQIISKNREKKKKKRRERKKKS